ncbi:serine protease [Glycomyces sp. YM15]|uniref:trypsin-like serine peptidase n=1 Tax=Glycomyces sp. YM15 TaxID=2800446 RepID=UPI00196305E9|nr:serine protease [Glycomyces sp. YM15]
MHTSRILVAAAFGAVATVTWAPAAIAEPDTEPRYAADQIAQVEPADVYLEAGEAHLVRHEDAAFIKARFDEVVLGSGDTLTVASPDGAESYVYGAADVEDGELRALSIEGDTAEVLLRDVEDGVPAKARLVAYSRGLNETELASRPSEWEAGPESICGNDDTQNAACYRGNDVEAWEASRSVARLIIDDRSYCTAWLADHGNRLLTNNHCFTTSREARVTEVQFKYKCRKCAGGAISTPLKVRGAKVLTTNARYDFTLFTVDDYAKIDHLPHLELDSGHADKGEEVFIPEHPGGRPLRIASASDEGKPSQGIETCRILDNRAVGYVRGSDLSYYCDTEGGSSGSPVISRSSGAVVGLHHLGGCPNSAVRMDLIYPMIKPYLKYDF